MLGRPNNWAPSLDTGKINLMFPGCGRGLRPAPRQRNISWEAIPVCVCCVGSVAQLCPTLCDPIDCSPPGSSFQGVHLTIEFSARFLHSSLDGITNIRPSLFIFLGLHKSGLGHTSHQPLWSLLVLLFTFGPQWPLVSKVHMWTPPKGVRSVTSLATFHWPC